MVVLVTVCSPCSGDMLEMVVCWEPECLRKHTLHLILCIIYWWKAFLGFLQVLDPTILSSLWFFAQPSSIVFFFSLINVVACSFQALGYGCLSQFGKTKKRKVKLKKKRKKKKMNWYLAFSISFCIFPFHLNMCYPLQVSRSLWIQNSGMLVLDHLCHCLLLEVAWYTFHRVIVNRLVK